MSETLDENDEPVSQEDLEEIDDILQEASPEFVDQLKSINAENLNHQDLGLSEEEQKKDEEKASKWYYRVWFSLGRTQQLLVLVGGFAVFVALPLLLLSVFGVFTPSFLIADQTSLAVWADEKMALDLKLPQKDLMDLFLSDQYFLEIPEQIYVIEPKGEIKIGRFAFYMELFQREDEPFFKQRYEEIIEILSRTLKQHSVDDFKGVEGKEEMRKTILAALNTRLETKIKNIRYKLVVF